MIWARGTHLGQYHAIENPKTDAVTVCGNPVGHLKLKLTAERKLPFGIPAVPLTEHRCAECDAILRAWSRNPTQLERNPARGNKAPKAKKKPRGGGKGAA